MLSTIQNRNVFNRGYVMMILSILFAGITIVLVIGGAVPVISNYASVQGYAYSKQAFLNAATGLGDTIYRLKTGKTIPASVTITNGNGTVVITASDTSTGKRIYATSTSNGFTRIFQVDLSLGDGTSFHYGIQSGMGGFVLQNSSSVTGNVYSNGTITGAGNYIYGDVVSSGSSGLISGIHATGTAYAHTITNSTIDKDAYYVTKTSTTVSGTSYPNSSDQPAADMPISDSQISDWEAWAATGTIYTCSSGQYTITSSITIGPAKVPCDLLIKGNGIIVNIAGPVWVMGNITTQNGPIIKMDSSLGSQNVALIADNPGAPTTQGLVSIGQNTQFQSDGSVGNFVFTISGNTASENGINTNAIDMGQSAGALVAYANHGQITLGQSVGVKEVTAYKIILTNTANVTYDKGLPSVLFKAGPSGGYTLLDWMEI